MPPDDLSEDHGPIQFRGQPAIALHQPGAGRVVVMQQGAQVVSWCTADDSEQLFLSPKAVFDGRSAIRGGVPVCFPQFNQRVLANRELPKHGFARGLPWRAADPVTGSDSVSVQWHLNEADLSAGLWQRWPMAFAATLEVMLAPGRLRVAFEVHNTGAIAWPFALALHTYLRVADLSKTRLNGLQGLRYWDAVTHLHDPQTLRTQSQSPLSFSEQTDRVYRQVPRKLSLECPDRTVRIEQSSSFSETVVWNPGSELCATLADMPADGYRQMVCVEAAKIDQPVVLEPGERWHGWQQLTIAPGAGHDPDHARRD